MRRDQIITLSVVIVLTTAVLVAKAGVKTGGQDTSSPAFRLSSLEEADSAVPTEVKLSSQAAPTSVPEATPPAALLEKPPASTVTLHADGRPALLFFDRKHDRCECMRRQSEPAERLFPILPRDLLAEFAVYRINIEERTDLVHQHHVMLLPAVILLDAEGEEVYREEYSVHREPLMEAMTALLAKELETGR